MAPYDILPNQSIRLLKLLPEQDNLVIELCAFHISELPIFEALSYAWGTEAFTEQVQCLSQASHETEHQLVETELWVSPHLLEGLRCLKATATAGDARWLWIDALCINQADAAEKSVQVPLMSKIYSMAQRVVVWLGRAGANSISVMREIPKLASKMSEIKNLSEVNSNTVSSFGLPDEPDTPDAFWYHLAQWYDEDWFRRLWVLQEACLAKDLVFMCGTAAVTLEDATKLAELWRQTQIVPASKKDGRLPAGLDFLSSIDGFKSMLGEMHEAEFTMLLNITRSLECRQIVDRIYGLLGMLPDRLRDKVAVDYSRENTTNPEALFTQVGKLALEERGPMNRFAVFWLMSRPRMPNTPSWLPGYMYPLDGQALYMERAGLPKDTTSLYYDPQISTSLSASPESFMHPDNIKIRGMIVDEVVDLVHLDWHWTYTNGNDEDDMSIRVQNASDFLSIEARCAALAAKVGTTSHRTSTTYYRTLVANRDISNPGPYPISDICKDYRDALHYFHLRQSGVDQQGLRPSRPRLHRYISSISEKWRSGRSFFTTTAGRIGIGGFNSELKAGDDVCIFFGAHQLFVLREIEHSGLYTMVGDAYIHGLMDCEAFDLKDPRVDAQTFEIC